MGVKRFTVDLGEHHAGLLDDLMASADRNQAEVIRRALEIHHAIETTRAAGTTLKAVRKDGTEYEIVVLP